MDETTRIIPVDDIFGDEIAKFWTNVSVYE